MARLRFSLMLVSLACCVLLLTLWIRSYWRGDMVVLNFASGQYVAGTSVVGQLLITWQRRWDGVGPGWEWASYSAPDPAEMHYPRTCLWYEPGGVGCQMWILVILTLILPALWLRRRQKRNRSKGFPVEVSTDA